MAQKKRKTKAAAPKVRQIKKIPQAPRGKVFGPGNQWRFPPGVSGNPEGRRVESRPLSGHYKRLMDTIHPADPHGRTYGELIALGMATAAIKGNPNAAKELRQATEGTRIVTWQDMVIDALRSGRLTDEQVREELGTDADILIRTARPALEGGAAPAPGGTSAPDSPGADATPGPG